MRVLLAAAAALLLPARAVAGSSSSPTLTVRDTRYGRILFDGGRLWLVVRPSGKLAR